MTDSSGNGVEPLSDVLLQNDDLESLSERVSQVSMETDEGQISEDLDFSKIDLPNVIIVTNIHDSVFADELIRVGTFLSLFLRF